MTGSTGNIDKVKPDLSNEDVNLELEGITPEQLPEIDFQEQVVETLADGTEIIKDEFVEEEIEEQISDEDLRKTIEFATGEKNISDEELQRIREDDDELERIIRISLIKARHFTYKPKKHFGKEYRKKRKFKNRRANKQRIINRK